MHANGGLGGSAHIADLNTGTADRTVKAAAEDYPHPTELCCRQYREVSLGSQQCNEAAYCSVLLTVPTDDGGAVERLMRPSSSTICSSTDSAVTLSRMLSSSVMAARSRAEISLSTAPSCVGRGEEGGGNGHCGHRIQQ